MHTNIELVLKPNFMSSLYAMIKLSKTSSPQKLVERLFRDFFLLL